ncbi:transcription factor Jun-like [Babylonia areolata]|uniref:transcription factor Jun-like n=1 Tax=Babylonia areolata TaxID=304850 RepID=UPI003FD2E1D3
MEQSMFTSSEPESAVKRLKRNMTLDFNGSSSTKAKKTAALLQSPDLHMLKLASPELEKMIIQANGNVTTTPTPTQFIFPKFVTEEQEAYARGFVDALAQLQSREGSRLPLQPSEAKAVITTSVDQAIGQSYPVSTVSDRASLPEVTQSLQQVSATTTLPNGVVLTTSGASLPVSTAAGLVSHAHPKPSAPSSHSHQSAPLVDIRLPKLEEPPQTVPCLNSSPPLSPINMESQERIKLERKRARNRLAAQKCRTRKLERISRLEDRVAELKGQNSDLSATASSLREQVIKLKQQIVEHVSSGCQIMVTQNLAWE